MKKAILLYFFSLCTLLVSAQITFSPNPLVLSGTTADTDINVDIDMSQNSFDSIEVFWTLEKRNFPSSWESSVCDQFTCYQANKDESSSTHGNKMFKDTVYHWSMHLNPNGMAGIDTVRLKLYDDNNHSNLIYTIDVALQVDLANGVVTQNLNNDLNIYPNPASSYFQLSNDLNVSSIAIYNIVGKKMMTEKHIQGEGHDISDLRRGMYLVRLLDENDNMIKVIRMTKK